MSGITKFLLPKKSLQTVASRQAEGEAVTFAEVEAETCIECVTLPSEKAPKPAPKPVYGCDGCTRTFLSAGALTSHRTWSHPEKKRDIFAPPPRPPFPGYINTSFTVIEDGSVRLTLLINGKDPAQVKREAEEAARVEAAAKAEREAEQDRRAHQRQRQRETEEAVDVVEQRRGSDHRHQYSFVEKARVLDLLDQINANPDISNKGEAFEADPRRKGCPYKTANGWCKPAERRKIAVGCAQDHAKSLLRFDKESRKKGKYAPMETRLFTLFRERRARARKTSSRWLVHTAKHIMRNEFSEHAAAFKASKGWLQRFKRSKGIVTRKKTNVKNTTWEETEPVLQNYFRAMRRRLRDTEWRHARDAAVAAARAVEPACAPEPSPAEPPTDGTAGEAARAAARAMWDSRAKVSASLSISGEHVAVALSIGSKEVEPAVNAAPAAATAPAAAVSPSPQRSPRKRGREEDEAPAAEDPWWKRDRGKWGAYQPFQRANVDQVPLPFIIDMDYTLEEKGAKKVAINQLGPSLSKRQCTAQVCFRPEPPPPPPHDASEEVKKKYKKHLMEQPPPCLIFRGTGRNISQRELDAYPKELVVLWQPKAWVDRPTAIAWVEKGFKPMIDADKAAGVADDTSRYLLIQDNLDAQDAQRNPPYIAALAKCSTDDHKVPANKTDQVQPVDRGKGRQIKIYMGQEEDKWLEDDDNLQKYENNELTASDRRILIAQWFCKAYHRSNESSANRKYFEHAGALLTADCTDDNLIKLEGVPHGKTFTWVDDPLAAPTTADVPPPPIVPDPADEGPTREDTTARVDTTAREDDPDNILEEEDEEDEEDAPPAPRDAPDGFRIVDEPPPAAALVPKDPAQQSLVGRSLLYCWPSVGWCVGVVAEANGDRRFKLDGEVVNFKVHYEIDDNTSKHVLTLDAYGGEGVGSWVLLEACK